MKNPGIKQPREDDVWPTFAWKMLGTIRLHEHRRQEAMEALEQAAKLSPEDPAVKSMLDQIRGPWLGSGRGPAVHHQHLPGDPGGTARGEIDRGFHEVIRFPDPAERDQGFGPVLPAVGPQGA